MKIQNYLNFFEQEKINLIDNSNLYTSWENVPFLREFIKSNAKIKNNINLTLDHELASYKNDKVWVRGKRSESVLSMYDLYEFFLDSRIRYLWHDSIDNILISTTGKNGSYSHITDKKWFDHSIYKKFVLRQIINNNFINRSFRVGSDLKCAVIMSEFIKKESILHQITDKGLLFRFSDVSFLKHSSSNKFIHFKIPEILKDKISESSFSCSIESIFRYNKISIENVNPGKECYIFVPFLVMNMEKSDKSFDFSLEVKAMLKNIYDSLKNDFNFYEERFSSSPMPIRVKAD